MNQLHRFLLQGESFIERLEIGRAGFIFKQQVVCLARCLLEIGIERLDAVIRQGADGLGAHVDAQKNALLCVTQEGVVSFGIDTGRRDMLYVGNADQAAMCGDALLVRSGGAIVRVANGQSATIRRDGATLMGVYGQKVIQLTSKGVMTCDVNGENVTTILHGSFDSMSIANGVLYVGDSKGYTQYVTL